MGNARKIGGFGRASVPQGEIPAGRESREWSERRRAAPESTGMVLASLKEASRQPRCSDTSHRSAMAALTPCLGCEPRECGQSKRTWRSQDALVSVPCSGPPWCPGSGCSGLTISLELCFELVKNLVCTKAASQSSIKEIFPEPGREVGPGLKQINLYFIMLGQGFFVFRSALGSLGSLQPQMFPRPTFTFKRVSVAEQRNFCSFVQTSLPAEAALCSASLGLFSGCFSPRLLQEGALQGFCSSSAPG